MLIYEDRISVRIDDDEAGWTCRGFVCLCLQLNALRFQMALQIADVGE
jgi:hypothetical protein